MPGVCGRAVETSKGDPPLPDKAEGESDSPKLSSGFYTCYGVRTCTHSAHVQTFSCKMSCVTPELRVFSIHHPASQGERIAAIVSLMCILSHLSANCALQILENKAVGRMQISRFIAVLGGSHPGEINELPLGKLSPSLCRCRNGGFHGMAAMRYLNGKPVGWPVHQKLAVAVS